MRSIATALYDYNNYWAERFGTASELPMSRAEIEKFTEFAAKKWLHAGNDLQVMLCHSSLFDPIRDEPEFTELLEIYDPNAAEQRWLFQETEAN